MLPLSKSNLDVLKENTPKQTNQVPGRLLLNSPCCFPGGRRVHPRGSYRHELRMGEDGGS